MQVQQVLVWQAFGNIEVYAADTPGQFIEIFEVLQDTLVGWGTDLSLLWDDLHAPDMDQFKAARRLEKFVSNHRDHETFEVFEFKKVQGV